MPSPSGSSTDQHRGVGTSFLCDTKVGPIKLVDRMEITEWVTGSTIGVRHVGLVTGSGRFTLTAIDLGRRTRFSWEESLIFPWWLGGRVGSLVDRACGPPSHLEAEPAQLEEASSRRRPGAQARALIDRGDCGTRSR